jgi:hypothetical protein
MIPVPSAMRDLQELRLTAGARTWASRVSFKTVRHACCTSKRKTERIKIIMKENRTLERWFFYQDAASFWRWARLDVLGTVLGSSAAAFDSRQACVEDARGLGYRE